MLTVYGVYRSRATRVYWLLNEIDMPFESVPVIQANRLADRDAPHAPLHTRSEPFLAINPNGHIPVIDDGGLVLCESLAITLHLARKYGGSLGPAGQDEDALMTMWSLWAATEVEPFSLKVQNEKDRQARAAAVEALRKPFAVLDAALARTGHVVGGRFTVADVNLAEVVRYASSAGELFDAAPHVAAWLAACQSRPAFRAMWDRREAEPA